MLLTPGTGCGPRRAAAGAGACSRTIVTWPVPGTAESAARTEASIWWTTSSFAVLGANVTVTPLEATSMSLTRPKETMSRVKPG